MGIWTHDRFWHGRYSLELGRICIDAAFECSEFSTLVGAAAVENKSSCHLMTAVGMRPTSLVKRTTETGREVELQEFEITRHEWASRVKRGQSFESFGKNEPAADSVAKLLKTPEEVTSGRLSLQPEMA